jgi:hypothetical protein
MDSLHYLDSWNKHCGGGVWEFGFRSLSLAGSGLLAIAGGGLVAGGGPVGMMFGGSLIIKSGNDAYEAITGKRSIARDTFGDPLYDTIDAALIGYGFLRQVRKINYLGNPKRDFFTKDPITYERAFKQFSELELAHEIANITAATTHAYEKYSDRLRLEDAWNAHLIRVEISDD